MKQILYDGIKEQATVSSQRLEDARVLFNAGRWRGAMYVAGYAVECLLKAKLMQIYSCRNLRELDNILQRRSILSHSRTVFTHELETLFRLTPGFHRLRQNQNVWRQFYKVNRWTTAWRYTADRSTYDAALLFMDAVEKVILWIDSNL